MYHGFLVYKQITIFIKIKYNYEINPNNIIISKEHSKGRGLTRYTL